MIDALLGVPGQSSELALDGLALRQQLIANNIANSATPGYTPKRLKFEDILSGFFADGTRLEILSTEQMDSARTAIDSPAALEPAVGGGLALDQEMVDLTQSVIRYRALIEANAKRLAPIRLAIEDIRR